MSTGNAPQIFYARLDRKTQRRVLCTHVQCPGQIAEVAALPDGYIVSAPSGKMYVPHTRGPQDPVYEAHKVRLVAFGPGWVQAEDGTWYLPERARQQMARGHRPYRRPVREQIPGSISVPVITHMQRQGREDSGTQHSITPLASGRRRDARQCRVLLDYPASARCPSCGRLQVLDAQALKITTDLSQEEWPEIPEDMRSYNL